MTTPAKNGPDAAAPSLDDIRIRIDTLDKELLHLLNERALCSLAVGETKAREGGPIFRPMRERALLDKLTSMNGGPLPDAHLRAIYREILASSKALQSPLSVAFLGPEGTFSHMAGQEYFGSAVDFIPMEHLAEVFGAVENGRCSLGVVPLENSLHGTVGQSVDLFAGHEVRMLAEWFSRINLSLMSKEQDLGSITTVYSHAQPLGQCAEWLRRHLPHARQASLESTAAAAHKVLAEPGSAAIGNKALAARLPLTVLAESIEDISDNWTRFCAIGPASSSMGEGDKSSVLFSLPDTPGSLAAVLQCFAQSGINMTKLESRPMRHERWKYIFFADLASDLSTQEHAPLVHSMQKYCHWFRILGVYPAGIQTQARL